MNIDAELAKIEDLITKAENIRDQIKEAAEATNNILDVCTALGVVRVGIGKRNDTLTDSSYYAFGYDGSVFVDGNDKNGWPLAWAVARKAGVSSGCGNSGQHQIKGDYLNGVYVCEDGVWRKE